MEWGTYSMAPFSNRALISCSITRTCWGATLVKNTPIFYNLQDPTRYIWQKFPRCQNSTRGTSLSRLVSGFICSCAVRTTFWNGEPTGSVWTDRSETLLGGGGHPKTTTFPGGPWDMRSPETAAPWSTRGGRVGRTVPWRHRRETDTVKWGVDRSTSGGESSLAWALRRQVFFFFFFFAAALEIITVLRSVLHFDGFGWARFPCPHS